MGDAMAANTGGKHWIRYSYQDLAELGGASGDVMKDQIQNSTPEQGVKALLASGDVKKVGREDVRGVDATHYSGTVDVAGLTAKNSNLDAEQLAAFKEQLALAGVTTQTVDIWVDENDLLVKKTERGEMKTGTFNTTLFYSDYGTEVPSEKAGGLGHRGLQGDAEAGRYPGRRLLTPPARDERGRICSSRIRSRSLTKKPKTAGRRCASSEGR